MTPAEAMLLPGGESAEWLRTLSTTGPEREAALAPLHELLIRIALAELRRRSLQLRIDGPELDDLAHQAAADALLAIIAKLGQCRGESRFTSGPTSSSSSRSPRSSDDTSGATRPSRSTPSTGIASRTASGPTVEASEWRELIDALRRAVDDELTERQRRPFVAIVLNGVPLDALVAELGSSRNAIYKTIFDARRKLRAALVASGHLDHDATGQT